MNLIRPLFLLTTIIFLASCQETNTFDTKRSGYDYIRIPFIKPYEALRLNGSNIWGMNLFNETLTSSVYNIKKVNIVDDAILLYSTNTLLNGNEAVEAWFVIIPSKHVEQGFINYKTYLEFLSKNGINTKSRLYDINFISDYFDEHYPINWESLNRQSEK